MNTGELYAEAKDNWRILLLATMLVVSGIAITFGPDTEGPTSLKYGLQLSGGTQVRAPLEGQIATGLNYSNVDDVPGAEATVAEELGLPRTDVKAQVGANAFEVYSENVSGEAVAAALRAAGFDVEASDVEESLTRQTYEDAEKTIEAKLAESRQFSGGEVTVQQSSTGGRFLKIEVPGATRGELLELVEERGLVEVVAVYPEQTGNATVYRNETLFTQADLASVGTVDETQGGTPFVSVTLTEEATQQFTEDMRAFGFAGDSDKTCRFDSAPENPGHCLVVYKDGEYVNSFGMQARLARSLEDGSFGGSFRMTTGSTESAEEVRIAMKAGALPTDLDLDEGDSMAVESEFAQRFKLFSLITGIIAALAVALVVFVRYREPRVAAPMVVTALAEVFILLGVAAGTGLALNLSHIAGFIAVIGTGVDDLVIIADEVLDQGDISTRRVFQSRFRKAFWVIGVAAVTTIIAMAPLTVLSLGDLTGFALVTITGVLIGVLVTRPAYGDILRRLMTRARDG
jgi:preprotein translocase subunit SecD